jgi:hypothetical protein
VLQPHGDTIPAIAMVIRVRLDLRAVSGWYDQEFAEATLSECVVMKFSDCDTGRISMPGLRQGVRAGSPSGFCISSGLISRSLVIV